MLLVDTEQGRIISDEEVKSAIAGEQPYQQWLDEHLVDLEEVPDAPRMPAPEHVSVRRRQQAFGYTFEDLRKVLEPMASSGRSRSVRWAMMRRWLCCPAVLSDCTTISSRCSPRSPIRRSMRFGKRS